MILKPSYRFTVKHILIFCTHVLSKSQSLLIKFYVFHIIFIFFDHLFIFLANRSDDAQTFQMVNLLYVIRNTNHFQECQRIMKNKAQQH